MPNINDLLRDHVTLEVECFDLIYLNGYIPRLQTGGLLVTFMIERPGKSIPSPALLGKVIHGFVAAVKQFADDKGIPLLKFEHKQRKDDIANEMLIKRTVRDEVVFIGVAQKKARAICGRKRQKKGYVGFEYERNKSVYVNHYYFSIDDEDFGPVFIKICSYAPWGIKVRINGHEWAKRQMEKAGGFGASNAAGLHTTDANTNNDNAARPCLTNSCMTVSSGDTFRFSCAVAFIAAPRIPRCIFVYACPSWRLSRNATVSKR